MRIMKTAISAAAAALTLIIPGAGVKGQDYDCDYSAGGAPNYYESCHCSACGGSGGGCGYCWSTTGGNQSCYTDGWYCEPIGGWRPAE
jgi:hypothetical protein